MPGEKRGKLYEIIAEEGLRRAFPKRVISKQVPLQGSLIRSDLVLEPSKSENLALIFVTHSGSETKTTQKFRRDIAELLQALRSTNGAMTSVGVIFDANVLIQLVDAEKAIFDKVIIAEEIGITDILSIDDSEIEKLKFIDGEQYKLTAGRFPANVVCAMENAIAALVPELSKNVKTKGMASLLNGLLRQNIKINPKLGMASKYYKGCAALMLAEPGVRLDILSKAKLGTLPAHLPGYYYKIASSRQKSIAKTELIWIAKNLNHKIIVDSLAIEERPKASIYRSMMISSDYYPKFRHWLDSNGNNATYINKLLNDSFTDPVATAIKILGCSKSTAPFHNWAWTFFVALMREISGKKQSFGAKTIAKITGDRKYCMQNSIISDYECCQKLIAASDLAKISKYFADQINGINIFPPDLDVCKRMLHEIFVDKIGPHSVHPLPALVRKILRDAGMTPRDEWVRLSIADMTGAKGNAGRVRLISVKNTYIWCRAAQDGHEADKTKEVGTCIFGVSTRWDKSNKAIIRNNSKKIIFVVDGEFGLSQLEFLTSCGVDVILRPQMLETQLVSCIV